MNKPAPLAEPRDPNDDVHPSASARFRLKMNAFGDLVPEIVPTDDGKRPPDPTQRCRKRHRLEDNGRSPLEDGRCHVGHPRGQPGYRRCSSNGASAAPNEGPTSR